MLIKVAIRAQLKKSKYQEMDVAMRLLAWLSPWFVTSFLTSLVSSVMGITLFMKTGVCR